MSGHTGFINSLEWSPDDQQLATASDDSTAKVWNASTGKLLDISGRDIAAQSTVWLGIRKAEGLGREQL